MIELTQTNGKRCAFNSRLVVSIHQNGAMTYIYFGGNEDSRLLVNKGYEEVLEAIRAANANARDLRA